MVWLDTQGTVAVQAPRMREAMGASLVDRAKAGDVSAFRELYAQHQRQVSRQLAFLVPRSDLEDVLQDVFIEVFRSIKRFEGKSAFTTWLYRLTTNVTKMHLRRRASRPRVVDVEVPDLPRHAEPPEGPDEALARQLRVRALYRLLERLSGNLPAAGQAYDKALTYAPNDPLLWVDIGRLRYIGGEQLQAIDASQRALAAGPEEPRALEFRAQLLRDAAGWEAALPVYEQALEQAPNDLSLLGGQVRLMGWTLTTAMWRNQNPVTGQARITGTPQRPGISASFNDRDGKPLVFQLTGPDNWSDAMTALADMG